MTTEIAKNMSELKVSPVTTIIDDNANYNIKHPLERQWTLWYDSVSKSRNTGEKDDWMANLKKLITLGTVEDFWGVLNTIAAPNEIPNSSNYHFFVDGILPQWEDEQNKAGGKWVIEFDKYHGADFVEAWQSLLLGLIGENFGCSMLVCGAVASIRTKQFRIAVWIKISPSRSDAPTSEIYEKTKKVGLELREVMGVGEHKAEFVSHSDAAIGGSKRASSMIVI